MAEPAVRLTGVADSRRAGYALLAVLWLSLGITALTIAISAEVRVALATSRNRVALTIASWAAEGCLAQVRAVLAENAATGAALGDRPGTAVWLKLAHGEAITPREEFSCRLSVRAVGSRLDVNSADEGTLVLLLRHVGVSGTAADSLAAALADWKDADDISRPRGAEHQWYEAHGRLPPSNRPFTTIRELHLVRGLDSIPALDSLLDVESGPVAINYALPQLLALLPGFSEEAVDRTMEFRRRGQPLRSFLELSRALLPEARAVFDRATPVLAGLVTLEPVAWIVTARSTAGSFPVIAVVELRISSSGSHHLIVRRRSWVE